MAYETIPASGGGGADIDTVSTGLTLSSGTLTNDLMTGAAGGQLVVVGTTANSITTTITTDVALTISGPASMATPSITAGQLRLNQTGSDHPGLVFTKGATVCGAIRSAAALNTEYYANSHTFYNSPTSASGPLMTIYGTSGPAVTIPWGSNQTALLLNRAGAGTRQDILRTSASGTGNVTFGLGTSDNNTFIVTTNGTERMAFTGDAKIGVFATAAVVQQASAANLTNNVTSGGTDDTIADYSSLTVYATDAAAIRNDIYQLARKLKQVNDGLRLYGWLT